MVKRTAIHMNRVRVVPNVSSFPGHNQKAVELELFDFSSALEERHYLHIKEFLRGLRLLRVATPWLSDRLLHLRKGCITATQD